MPHPFQDKLIVFIGTPTRCTRQEARDALIAVGGVIDENISTFINYVVAFSGAEKTRKYSKALRYKSFLSIIDEDQFFDILEGRIDPPEHPKSDERIIFYPSSDPEAEAREQKLFMDDLIDRKRLDNLARHGIPTPDGGRIKIDARALDNMRRLMEFMQTKFAAVIPDKSDASDRCDNCYNPAKVYIEDGKGGEVTKLCRDCYNIMMAEMTGIDISVVIPKRMSFRSKSGKTYDFSIEFLIFENCITLTATEIGKTKRRAEVFGMLDDDFNEMLDTLERRIKKTLTTVYMDPDGYFWEHKAVGYIDYNHERDSHDIIIDGIPYTWSELEKNISEHEGWNIKIEFGDIGDELD